MQSRIPHFGTGRNTLQKKRKLLDLTKRGNSKGITQHARFVPRVLSDPEAQVRINKLLCAKPFLQVQDGA